MVLCNNVSPSDAMRNFSVARGHQIERPNYINAIMQHRSVNKELNIQGMSRREHQELNHQPHRSVSRESNRQRTRIRENQELHRRPYRSVNQEHNHQRTIVQVGRTQEPHSSLRRGTHHSMQQQPYNRYTSRGNREDHAPHRSFRQNPCSPRRRVPDHQEDPRRSLRHKQNHSIQQEPLNPDRRTIEQNHPNRSVRRSRWNDSRDNRSRDADWHTWIDTRMQE